MPKFAWSVVLSLVVCLPALSQTRPPTKTILDGVYSETQALRGKGSYTTFCAACHGTALEGVSAPELTGNRFAQRWREGTLDGIYSFIKQRMPFGRPANAKPIPDGEYLDILTYILSANGYAPGTAELSPDDLLKVTFVGRNGPQPVPDGALILTVGCLSQTGDGGWVLLSAAEPVRTRTELSSLADVKSSSEKAPGSLTFRLAELDAVPDFMPDAHKGHKIQVKGYLVRQLNAERISLSSMVMVNPTCP